MQTELHNAFLLHQRSYRESSLLLELFSAEHGRIGAVAKGATRRAATTGAVLQPFRPLLMAWTSRRSELVTLTHCEAAGHVLLGAGKTTLCGFYLNELVLQALPRNDPHPGIYADYHRALQALARSADAVEDTLRIFEKHLLEAMGYGLILDHDVRTRTPIVHDGSYLYLPGQGPTIADDADSHPGAVTLSGATLLALQQECFVNAAQLSDAKRLMRALLRAHLGDRPLHSRAWFDEY